MAYTFPSFSSLFKKPTSLFGSPTVPRTGSQTTTPTQTLKIGSAVPSAPTYNSQNIPLLSQQYPAISPITGKVVSPVIPNLQPPRPQGPIPSFATPAPVSSATSYGPAPVAPRINQGAPSGAGSIVSPPGTTAPPPAQTEQQQQPQPEPDKGPAPLTDSEKAVTEAERLYQESLNVSPDELSTQEDLDKLIEATKTAYRNTSNQPIALEFITGQLKSIEDRAIGLAEPLERKLARLQAKRTSAVEANKYALDRSDKRLTDAKSQREKDELAKKGTEVGGRIVRYNPATGKYETIYTPPEKPEKRSTSIEEFGDGKWLVDTQTGEKIKFLGTGPISASDRKSADSEKLANESRLSQAKESLDSITQLEDAPGLSSAVGASWSKFWRAATPFGEDPFSGTSRADFLSLLDQTKARLSFDNLQKLRGLGAMSDKEFSNIQAASAALKPTMSEAEFKNQLNIIKTNLQSTINTISSGGGSSTTNDTSEEYEVNGVIYTKGADGQYYPKQ